MLPPNIPRCEHIHLTGMRCGSPALRGQSHCYYHTEVCRERPVTAANIPALDHALNIQQTTRDLMTQIIAGQLDTKRCGLLLYALQIASSNMRWVQSEFNRASENDMVRELPVSAEPPTSRTRSSFKRPARSKSARRKPPASVPSHAQIIEKAIGDSIVAQLHDSAAEENKDRSGA